MPSICLLPSRLYCRYRSCTGSCAAALADFTADREFHPALKTFCDSIVFLTDIYATTTNYNCQETKEKNLQSEGEHTAAGNVHTIHYRLYEKQEEMDWVLILGTAKRR